MYSASTPPIFSIERAILSPGFKVFGPLKCTLRDESGIETTVVCCMLSPDGAARYNSAKCDPAQAFSGIGIEKFRATFWPFATFAIFVF